MEWKVKRKPISKGTCIYCEQSFSKSEMRAHLEACEARKTVIQALNKSAGAKNTQFFHLAIDSADYWMHLEIPADHTLQDLDQFLRDIWLECCGHLSQFIIGDTSYVGKPDETLFFDENAESFEPSSDEIASEEVKQMLNGFKQLVKSVPQEVANGFNDCDEHDMDMVLKDIFKPEMKLEYEYDFGSTTALKIAVVSLYDGKRPRNDRDPIHMMARNNAPNFVCDACGKPATLCSADDNSLVCNDHAIGHDVEMLLPVVNSPRMGVCAYIGEAEDGWDFWVNNPDYLQGGEGDDFEDDDDE